MYVPGSVNGDFNLLQLSALALYVGCSPAEAPIAAAIAAAESGGNPGAQGDIALMDGTWDWSQGLWQIRGLRSERGTGGLRDSLANANPEKNGRAMYTISSGCKDWTPWSTYTSGAYLSYLGMSKTAVLAAQQYQQQTGALPSFGTGNTVGVPSASIRRRTARASPARASRPRDGKSKPPSRHHRKPTSGGSTTPAKTPKPGSSTHPGARCDEPGPGAAPKSSLPVKLPSLPVKTTLPMKLPSKPKLKTKLPTKLPSVAGEAADLRAAVHSGPVAVTRAHRTARLRYPRRVVVRSPVAQLAEHSTVNRRVTGSSPVGGANPGPPASNPRRGHLLVIQYG